MAVLMSKMDPNKIPKRRQRTVSFTITERPERIVYPLKNETERDKLINTCEKFIRSSMEYRDYISFLKTKMDFNRCAVLKNVISGNGKKYTIEVHHEPFTLYDLVDLEILKMEANHTPLSLMAISEAVMELHYEGKVGLIPLSKTQHELVHSGKCFIPLQQIFQDYDKYYEEYEEYIEKAEHIKNKIDVKVRLSMECSGKIQTESLPEYVYLNVDGFEFPEIPDEWRDIANLTRKDLAVAEKAANKKKKDKKEQTESET